MSIFKRTSYLATIITLFLISSFAVASESNGPCEPILSAELQADLAQYQMLLARMATTDVNSGGTIAQKVLLGGLKNKLLQAGFSEETLKLRQAEFAQEQAVELAHVVQESSRSPLSTIPTQNDRNQVYMFPDGDHVGISSGLNAYVQIFKVGNYDVPVFETTAYSSDLTSTSDGKYLIVTYEYENRRRAKVYDIKTWRLVHQINDNSISSILLTEDERYIFLRFDRGPARLVELATFSAIELDKVDVGYSSAAIVTQDERFLLVQDYSGYAVQIIDLANRTKIKTILDPDNKSIAPRIRMLANSNFVAVKFGRSFAMKIGEWELLDTEHSEFPGQINQSLLDPDQELQRTFVTDDNKFLISIMGSQISIARISDRQFHYSWSTGDALIATRLTADSRYLITAWKNGLIHVVDIVQGKTAYSKKTELQSDQDFFRVKIHWKGPLIFATANLQKGILLIDHEMMVKKINSDHRN